MQCAKGAVGLGWGLRLCILRNSSVVGGACAAGLQITLYVAEESQDMGVQRAPSYEAFVSNTNTLWFILVCTSILHLSGLHLS